MGSVTSKSALRPYMAVPPQKADQADLCIPIIAVGMQVHLLILDRTPRPLHQDVVVATLPARPADLDPLRLRPGHEFTRGELTALVRVEDLWLASAFQHHLQSL